MAKEKTELVLFFVKNESDEIVMMARAKDDVDKGVKIDSESTAIALVLMHPFFSLLPEEEYDEMVELIKGVSSFFVLKENIQTITNVGGNLLSENCIAIQIALESVFEELQQLLDKNENIQSNSRSFSGPEGVYVDCDPLDIKAESNSLAMRVKGLAPTYNGIMINSQKEVIDEFTIPTRDDYGFLDLFNKTVDNWQYGETIYTQIPSDGEFKFTFKVDVGNLLSYMVSYGIDMLGGSKILKKQFGIDTNKMTEFLYDRFVSYLSAQAAPGTLTVLSYTEIIWGGFCDYLCFGSESGSAEALTSTAQALLSADFSPVLREYLEKGLSFPAARQGALEAMGMDASCLSAPNDILAVEYCKAILAQNTNMKPLPIRRGGSYHDTAADPENPSATAVRGLMVSGQDWGSYVPEAARSIFSGAAVHTLSAGERAVLAVLRSMAEDQFAALPYGSEGLWRKLMHTCRKKSTLEEIASEVKSKRYTRSRIDRMILCAFLGITEEMVASPAPYCRVLAFNDRGRAILKKAKEAVPILNAGEPSDDPYWELEKRWGGLYGLFAENHPDVPNSEENRRIYYHKETKSN